MDNLLSKKLIWWGLLSLDLVAAFFIGLFVPLTLWFLHVILVALLIVFIFMLLIFFEKLFNASILKAKLIIGTYFTLNILFSYLIGATIPLMESPVALNMGYVMIPLLILLNYVILGRFHLYISENRNPPGGIENDR